MAQETRVNDVKYVKNFDSALGVKSFWSYAVGRTGGVALVFLGRQIQSMH